MGCIKSASNRGLEEVTQKYDEFGYNKNEDFSKQVEKYKTAYQNLEKAYEAKSSTVKETADKGKEEYDKASGEMQKILNDMKATAQNETDKAKQTKLQTVTTAATSAYNTFFGAKSS